MTGNVVLLVVDDFRKPMVDTVPVSVVLTPSTVTEAWSPTETLSTMASGTVVLTV